MGGIKVEKIKIKNLIFSYPNSEKTALNDINLTINQGEFVTICGKSGCGKSTLLRHLKPILIPHGKTSGEIYFDGKSIYDLSDREQAENIGFVMQNPDNQVVTDKVWHELVFGLESLGINSAEIRSKAAEMASIFRNTKLVLRKCSQSVGRTKTNSQFSVGYDNESDIVVA